MNTLFKVMTLALLASMIGCAGDSSVQDLPSKKAPSHAAPAPATFSTPPPPDITVSAPPVYTWVTTNYGACSTTCGGGSQSRTVSCIATNGTIVADSFCTSAKPAMT